MSNPTASPECRHILATGQKCHAIALRDRPFCFHHAHVRTIAAQNLHLDRSLILPPIEDHASVLLAINQVLTALATGRIDIKTAGRYIYGLQVASQTIRRIADLPPIEPVTDYCDGICGDTVAVADPGSPRTGLGSWGGEPGSNQPDPPLLSKEAKAGAIHGEPAWEPSNADCYNRLSTGQNGEENKKALLQRAGPLSSSSQ